MRNEATTVKNEIRDVWSEVGELTRMQEEAATVNKEIREVWMKIHGLKDMWTELKQDVIGVADLCIPLDTIAEDVRKELHESKEMWTALKQDNEQLKIVMLNLKQENNALNAAVAKMQAYMPGWA